MHVKVGLMSIAALAMIAGTPSLSRSAALDVPPSKLDSRTVPHGDWVQISGEIQQTMKVQPEGGQEHMMAMIQPVEGGQIVVDLGPAASLGSIHLQDKDYVHVRGTPVQQGDRTMIMAREIIADGKMVPIQQEAGQTSSASTQSNAARPDQVRPHPAAPSAEAGRQAATKPSMTP